jgi:hypothetical protein
LQALMVVHRLKVIPPTNESSQNSYRSACYLLRLGHPFKFSKVHGTARALKPEYFLELYLTAFFSSSSSLPHQPQFIDSTTPPLSLQSGIIDQPAPTFHPKRTITHHLTIHRHDATQSPSSQPYGSLPNSKPRRHFQ